MDEDILHLGDQCVGWKEEDCFVHSLSSLEEYPVSSSADLPSIPFEALEEGVRAFVGQRQLPQGRSDQKIL
jgi:hypothetical protein